MAYVTAITDRTQADIIALNSKAYFNTADWTRVYGNSLQVNTDLQAIITIAFDALSTPTTAVIPTINTTYPLNPMLANIERMRAWADDYLYEITDADFSVKVKDDWLSGQSNVAPNFLNANHWENVLDILYNYLQTFTPPTISGDWKWEDGTSWVLEAGGNWQHE